MALTAALGVALATVSAAALVGLPWPLIAALLVPGVTITAARPDRRVEIPRPLLLGAMAAVVAFAVFVITPSDLQRARYVVLAVAALSVLWPTALRPCVALAAIALVAAAPSLSGAAVPLTTFAFGIAVALVALNRMRGPAGRRLDGRGPSVANHAAALLAIAGVIALLAASLLPDPNPRNQAAARGAAPRAQQAQAGAPYLQPADELDAGGAGTGKGDQIVFRVTAPHTALWRTMTFDAYDGRTWRRTLEATPARPVGGLTYVPGSGSEFGPSVEEFIQRIRIEAPAVGVLPAAPRVFSLRLPVGTNAHTSEDGTVEPTPMLGKGAVYVATSYQPSSDADVLRRADTGDLTTPPFNYLALPGRSDRVAELARDLTGDATTRYDRTAAVESWLRTHTDVALDAPAVPAGADPVDQFLFTDLRGSSQQAASAMAVMLRTLGIPSRVAVGYVSPTPSAFGGEMVVRARHAHAWVEVWFAGAGWVAFDPAGRFTAPGEDIQSWWSRLKRLLGALWWVLALAVLAVATWFVARLVRRRRRLRHRPWATRVYERVARVGEKRGRPRMPTETPLEYCTALGNHVLADVLADVHGDVLADRLARVGALITAAAWSPDEPPAPERAWADEVVRDLEQIGSARP